MPIYRTKHVFEKQLSNTRINQILSVLSSRKLDSGHCIRYQNKYYIPIMENTQKVYIQEGMTAMVIQTLDGSLYVDILDSLFSLKEVPVRETKSKTFDLDVQEKKQKHHNSDANV